MGAVGSALSRRVSEVVGVALFAARADLADRARQLRAERSGVVLQHGHRERRRISSGRVGAFLAELSFQLLGYGSYLLPAVIVVAGWHYFWCRRIEAVYTKMIGAALVLACTSAFMSLALGSVDVGDRPFRAGGYLGEFLAGMMAEYLSRTGSIIVILTLLSSR